MIIAGAGGHAIETLDILLETIPKEEIVFFDDVTDRKLIHDSFPVLKDLHVIASRFASNKQFCLGVGNVALRKLLYEKLISIGGELKGLRALSAEISPFSHPDKCADICKQAFISGLVEIGMGTLVNTAVKIHHHVAIGSFCEISPGSLLLGGARIGDECTIGAGSIVLPKISICDNTIVGAGAIVNRNISEAGTYVGNPAKRMK